MTPVPARADHVVVGAGIVGLAVARELALREPRARVVVIEREREIAAHQTSHNSGVVHSGVYYEPGGLKASLCVAGARALTEYCDARSLPFRRAGKLIVARDGGEVSRLDEIERRGRLNGVPGLRRLAGGREIAAVDGRARGVAALHLPETAITDFGAVARAFADDLREAGGTICTGCEVTSIADGSGGARVGHGGGAIEARRVVVCAGAWSDRLAVAGGAPADPRIVPFRGAYLRLRPAAARGADTLIYPVPDPALPFLGVHVTPTIGGDVLIGPTALLSAARAAGAGFSVADVAATLAWPGSWRMFRRWWRTGLTELRHAVSRRALVAEAATLWGPLGVEDVESGFRGVRAQALDRDGRLLDDFAFSATEHVLHVRNAPSPAATSSLEIARVVADRLR